MTSTTPNFDRLARPYQVLEHLTMGKSLERTRFAFLESLADCSNALVLGDGDGRFTEKLLKRNSTVRITAVDISGAMLRLLKDRCSWADGRVVAVQDDALHFCRQNGQQYDLVITHFFLDCLSQNTVYDLAREIAQRTSPGALWVVSEFAIPQGALRYPARMLVRGLYMIFRLVTGLRVSQLPDHASALAGAGFVRAERQTRLGGVLCAEFWKKPIER